MDRLRILFFLNMVVLTFAGSFIRFVERQKQTNLIML